MTREEIVVGLDIGTTKVCTVIAQGAAATGAPGEETGPINVIGVGVVPSRGIKKGVVVDVEDTVAAIRDSVERAAHMAGVKVEGAVTGITGNHIQSSNRRGTVTVASPQGAISRFDVERVLQAAALEIPRDREIIHSLPRDFIVDGHPGVKRPIGMAGQRLEVETHVVTGKASFLQNAVQCVERAGLNVEALVLEPIATAEAVTTADERDMGVILIDIGGGTSDIAVFIDGSIIYSSVLPVGGNHVTRDIAIGLRTPFEVAEKLKIERGAATQDLIPHGEALEVLMAGSGERLRIPRALLGEIIEARMSELFELSREAMYQAGVKKRLPGGVIISGGGALLPGAADLGAEIFQMPVRLGFPIEIAGWAEQVSNPQFATGVGLCRFALRQRYAPGNHAAIPAIASTEGRRIWGAIASPLLVPSPQLSTPGATTIETAENEPIANENGRDESEIVSPSLNTPVSSNGSTPEKTPFDAPKPAPLPLASAAESAQKTNRADDIRGELFRREEIGEESAPQGFWAKIWAKIRDIIGFEKV
ncbi:MAG TPA: cell division protein FtsA [Abditibacterium sp.]